MIGGSGALKQLRELSPRSPDRQPDSGQLPEPRMELRDLVSEAAAGLMARPRASP